MSAQTLHPARPGAGPRRLSNMEVNEATFVDGGPMVIVPPKHMMAESTAHETAAQMEKAFHHLKKAPDSTLSTPGTPPPTLTTDRYAFAFDIDGVLIRGGKAIPEAIEAMKVLNGENEYGIKVYVSLFARFVDTAY